MAYAIRRRQRELVPLGDPQAGGHDDDQAVVVLASWAYVGAGYATEGEAWLAPSAAARARERRRLAARSASPPHQPLPHDRRDARSAAGWEDSLDKLLLTPEEAAQVLSIGRSKVYELMRTGRLESVRIDASRRVPMAAIEDYVDRLRAAASSGSAA